MENVALYKGNSRYDNILNSMNLISSDIEENIKNKNKIIIKPNCVLDSIQKASTHVDAIRAVLDFISEHTNKKITIAEGSAYQTINAFEKFNYYLLKDNYNLNFIDLNNDKFEEIEAFDRELKPIKIGIAKTII